MNYEIRHYGNFGLLIDNHTNQITASTPYYLAGSSFFGSFDTYSR